MIKRGIQPKVILGILVLLVSIIAIIVVAAPMQSAWGMWGLALTEFMLLALAISCTFLFKWDFKAVFTIKKPRLYEVLGVLVLWLASYIFVNTISMVLYYWFPAGMGEISISLTSFFTSIPLPLALVVVAILPGICEEFLHRGLIQHTFKGKPKWVTILSMSIIFGVFHLDLFRFLPTAFLGGVLTYIMLETNNLLLPILLHSVNNAVTTLLAFGVGPVEKPGAVSLSTVGLSLIAAVFVPLLFEVGRRLILKGKGSNQSSAKKGSKVIIPLFILLFLVAGMSAIILDQVSKPVFNTSFSQQVTDQDRGHDFTVVIEKAGKYRLDLAIQGQGGLITSFKIVNDQQEEIYFASADWVTLGAELEFEPGDYFLSVEYDLQSLEPVPVKVDIVIRKGQIF